MGGPRFSLQLLKQAEGLEGFLYPVLNKAGQYASAFFTGLGREKEAPDFPELDGLRPLQGPYGTPGEIRMIKRVPNAIAADETALALAEPVLVPVLRFFAANDTAAQLRLKSGKGKQTELKDADKLLPEGGLVEELKKAGQQREELAAALSLRSGHADQFGNITGISQPQHVTVNVGIGMDNFTVIEPHQGGLLLFKKANGTAGEGFQSAAEPLPASFGPFGDAPQLAEIPGKACHQLI